MQISLANSKCATAAPNWFKFLFFFSTADFNFRFFNNQKFSTIVVKNNSRLSFKKTDRKTGALAYSTVIVK